MEDSTACINQQTSTVTPSKKRAKLANLGTDSSPSKRSKPGIASDDLSVLNGGQSKEASNVTVGQTSDEDENLSSGKKKKREKGVESKRHMTSYARKKGRLSANSRGLKTLPQAAGGLIHTTTPSIAKEKHVISTSPIRVVVGLQCYAVTISRSKKSEQLTSESPQTAVEPVTPQSAVPLASKTIGNQETDGETVIKRKRGRPYKVQPKKIETSLAVNHENGIELTSQQEMYDKPVKGKRGKRRTISLNVTSSPQEIQDSSKEKEIENSEVNVEKSIVTVSDDQPLSRWLHGKQSLATLEPTDEIPAENSESLHVTNGEGQTLTFEKRSSFWKILESMEAFRLIPQNPHFRPLDNVKESARERHAINKMVDFSGVFEDTRRLHIDHPRTEIEDRLETLSELETHGFDVGLLRTCLFEFISFKEKREALERRSKDTKCDIENRRVTVHKLEKEIESIDKQVSDLLEKRHRFLKEREQKGSEIVALEAEIGEIEEGIREYCSKFDELATSVVGKT